MERRGARQVAKALPRVGTVVELGVEAVRRTWRTRIEAVEGARLLVVAPSRPDGTPFTVADGTVVRLDWPTAQALQRAEGRVTGGDVDVVPRWWITVERLTRVQRRDAYRLRVVRPVTLLVEGDQLSGVTGDLSEGGALVAVPAPVDAVPGQRARVRLALSEHEVLLLDAEVVRLGPVQDGQARLGLRFQRLDEETADRVRRFVLEEQLRRRHAPGDYRRP